MYICTELVSVPTSVLERFMCTNCQGHPTVLFAIVEPVDNLSFFGHFLTCYRKLRSVEIFLDITFES